MDSFRFSSHPGLGLCSSSVHSTVYWIPHFPYICLTLILSLQLFWVKDLMEGDNQKSVLHMFREPVVGNTIQLFFQHDVCSSDDDYAFCIQLEVYGRCLGLFQ